VSCRETRNAFFEIDPLDIRQTLVPTPPRAWLRGNEFLVAMLADEWSRSNPGTGFDKATADAAFFAGTTVKSNFLCNLGHGDPGKLHPSSPRLSFDEACRIA
jgi:hypothetical protein